MRNKCQGRRILTVDKQALHPIGGPRPVTETQAEPKTKLAAFRWYAAHAKLTSEQVQACELWLAGSSHSRIACALRLSRVQVFWLLRSATDAISKIAPDFWEAGNAFPRHLIKAVTNHVDHRDGNLSGVAPAHDVRDHLPKSEVFTADRHEIRQSKEWCLRHWARELAAA
jgi:hypothetical protein